MAFPDSIAGAVEIKKAADKLPHRRYFELLPVSAVANKLWAVQGFLRLVGQFPSCRPGMIRSDRATAAFR
jgi:hypothetical protein